MTERDIFLAVLDLPDPAARAAYLDAACGGDAARRARVEGLLRSHEAAGSFLAAPAVAQPEPDRGATRTLGPDPAADPTPTGGAPPADDEALTFLAPPGRTDSLGRLGHYEVLEVLGRGGFGIVFRAFDEVLQRVVAVKVLAPAMAATSPARKRFLREARSSAQVRHENVVQVYAVEEQPLPYLVMEFIPGETLQQRLDRTGPLDVPEVLRIGRQVAEGLAAAHAQGLIHRDIKPANVLIEGGPQGRVKLTDFGLARAADDASISQSGIVAGTPMYMAPEQARGETLDHRADLFSLGSVLYTMLTGHPPFRAGGTLAVLKRVCEDDPRPIREVIPEVPDWLCRIVEKLHAKDPAGRFQSARDVADVLADCEAQWSAHGAVKDISRIPGARPVQPRRTSRRERLALAAAIAVVLAAGLYVAVRRHARVQETVLLQTPGPASARAPQGPGWVELFNGKDLEGWYPVGSLGTWVVEGGVLRGSGFPGYLVSNRSYARFHLHGEVRVSPHSEFGILFHTDRVANDPGVPTRLGHGFEVAYAGPFAAGQVNTAIHFTGESPRRITDVVLPSREFMPFDVIAQDGEARFVIAGHPLAAEFEKTSRAGPIILRLATGGSVVELRGLRIKDLSASDAGETSPAPVAWGEVVDPLGDCRVTDANGLLTVAVPGTRAHNLNPSPGFNLNAPRVLRDVEGDFEARVTVLPYRRPQSPVTTSPSQPYVGAGLVVWQDDAHFLRLFRSWMPTANTYVHPEWYGGTAPATHVTATVPDRPTQLRVRRTGDRLDLAASLDGQTWTEVTTAKDLKLAARVRVGVAAVNSTDEDLTARFEGFTVTKLSPQTDGWVQLFNGKDLSGWKKHPDDPGEWSVEDGAIVAAKGETYLFTEKGDYADFDLRVEAKIDTAADAGVIFRSPLDVRPRPNGTVAYTGGYEAQINLRPGWPVHTGSLCWPLGETPAAGVLKKGPVNPHRPGEWFVLEVLARGNHIQLRVDGKLTADYVDEARTYRRGHIALQKWSSAVTTVQFRKVEIKQLPPAGAAATRSDQEAIQGTWIGVSADVQGQQVPELVLKAVGPTVTFAEDKVTWKASPAPEAKDVFAALAKFSLEGVFHLDPAKSPRTIDLTVLGPNARTPLGTPAPRALLGIYRLDGDSLEICTAIDPEHAEERPSKFESAPGKFVVHIKLRRQTPPAGGADPAAVPALRDLVAAKGRALDMVRIRFEAGHANALDKALAEIELIEARVRLAEAEDDRAAVVSLLQDLVARREDERRFIAAVVEVGRAPPDDLDRADARLAEAKARLARVQPAGSPTAPKP